MQNAYLLWVVKKCFRLLLLFIRQVLMFTRGGREPVLTASLEYGGTFACRVYTRVMTKNFKPTMALDEFFIMYDGF